MDLLYIVIAGSLLALFVWGVTKWIASYTYNVYESYMDNRDKRERIIQRKREAAAKKERISLIVKRLYEKNDYLVNLVISRRSLPLYKHNKRNKHSPTKFVDDHLIELIQDQIRRSMTTAEHTYYHEVYKRIVD